MSRGPNLKERNRLGQTPVHLASDWPYALKMLLESGADMEALDCDFCSPLYYSCNSFNSECTQILLDAGCCLVVNHEYTGLPPSRAHPLLEGYYSEWSWLSDLFGSYHSKRRTHHRAAWDAIRDAIISCLVVRRKQLLEMAKQIGDRLPWWVMQTVTTHEKESRILDEKFVNVLRATEDSGVRVPDSLWTQPMLMKTIYHTDELCPTTAERLFEVGFRDIDVRGLQQLTPLMKFDVDRDETRFHGSIQAWLLRKGASLQNIVGLYWYAAHFIAMRLSAAIFYNRADFFEPLWFEATTPCSKFNLRSGFLVKDGCQCACSFMGCVMLTIFLSYGAPILSILETLSTLTEEDISPILRFSIFEALGLTHTCCVRYKSLHERHHF